MTKLNTLIKRASDLHKAVDTVESKTKDILKNPSLKGFLEFLKAKKKLVKSGRKIFKKAEEKKEASLKGFQKFVKQKMKKWHIDSPKQIHLVNENIKDIAKTGKHWGNALIKTKNEKVRNYLNKIIRPNGDLQHWYFGHPTASSYAMNDFNWKLIHKGKHNPTKILEKSALSPSLLKDTSKKAFKKSHKLNTLAAKYLQYNDLQKAEIAKQLALKKGHQGLRLGNEAIKRTYK